MRKILPPKRLLTARRVTRADQWKTWQEPFNEAGNNPNTYPNLHLPSLLRPQYAASVQRTIHASDQRTAHASGGEISSSCHCFTARLRSFTRYTSYICKCENLDARTAERAHISGRGTVARRLTSPNLHRQSRISLGPRARWPCFHNSADAGKL